jgi:hypothetical protein
MRNVAGYSSRTSDLRIGLGAEEELAHSTVGCADHHVVCQPGGTNLPFHMRSMNAASQEEEMSRINGEKARAALAKRQRTAQRVKARASRAAAMSASANGAPTTATKPEKSA